MARKLLLGLVVTAALLAGPLAAAAGAADFDVPAEIAAANAAIELAHSGLGGMGGIGTIPEPDLGNIQALLGEAETMLRDARRRAQGTEVTPQDQAWIVSYARAAAAMATAVDEYRRNRGYL